MAQYKITVDDEILEGLFQRDGGVAKLVESVVNQILQAQVQEHLKAA
ncbi:IS256 family transposase, partial [Hydrogenibacillus schlegelii]